MTVRSKAALIIGLVLIGVLGALYGGSRLTLQERFLALEQAQLEAQTHAALERLAEGAVNLDAVCAAYAAAPLELETPQMPGVLNAVVVDGLAGVFEADGSAAVVHC